MTDHAQEMSDNSESLRAARAAATAAELAEIEASIPRLVESEPVPTTRDALDALRAIEPLIEAQWQQVKAETNDVLSDDANLNELRAAGTYVQKVWEDYVRQEASIQGNRSLSDQGKSERLEHLRLEREAALDRIEKEGVPGIASRFLSAHQPPTWGVASPEVAQRASLLIQKFPLMTAEAFEQSAVETLATAIQSTDNRVKSDCNILLREVYLDLMRRRAQAPESHAQNRKQAASAIEARIAQHLDNLAQTYRARMAQAAVRLVTNEVRTVRQITHKNGRFDITLARAGAPNLFPAAA